MTLLPLNPQRLQEVSAPTKFRSNIRLKIFLRLVTFTTRQELHNANRFPQRVRSVAWSFGLQSEQSKIAGPKATKRCSGLQKQLASEKGAISNSLPLEFCGPLALALRQ